MMDKKLLLVYGDGIHDDTEAIQAYLNGEAELILPDGKLFPADRKYYITKVLIIRSNEQKNPR